MELILIRSPQLLFYKMKSKKEDKNMTTDTNYHFLYVIFSSRTITIIL